MNRDTSETSIAALCQGFRRVLLELPPAVWKGKPIPAVMVASPVQLLPAWLVEADRLWREMTGRAIGMRLAAQPAAPLGAVVAGEPLLARSAILVCMTYTAMGLRTAAGIDLGPLVERFEIAKSNYLEPAARTPRTPAPPARP
jgi:hypothetical protein